MVTTPPPPPTTLLAPLADKCGHVSDHVIFSQEPCVVFLFFFYFRLTDDARAWREVCTEVY